MCLVCYNFSKLDGVSQIVFSSKTRSKKIGINFSCEKLLFCEILFCLFFKLGFTPCKAEQPLRGMELQEKEAQKDYSIQEICLERTYSYILQNLQLYTGAANGQILFIRQFLNTRQDEFRIFISSLFHSTIDHGNKKNLKVSVLL